MRLWEGLRREPTPAGSVRHQKGKTGDGPDGLRGVF